MRKPTPSAILIYSTHIQQVKEVYPPTHRSFPVASGAFIRPDIDADRAADQLPIPLEQPPPPASDQQRQQAHDTNDTTEAGRKSSGDDIVQREPSVGVPDPGEHIDREPVNYPPDKWEQRGSRLVRVHTTPRRKLFCPDDVPNDPPPVPLADIDVMRTHITNSDMKDEQRIDDVWFGSSSHRELSCEWTGETIFDPIPPPAPPGHTWVAGRMTKIQQTSRPPDIWPEHWITLGKQQKALAPYSWRRNSEMIDCARKLRGLATDHAGLHAHIDGERGDVRHLQEVGSDPDSDDAPMSAPGMAVAPAQPSPPHIDHDQLWTSPPAYFALVAEPVPMPHAIRIPAAVKALDDEWDKHLRDKTWLMDSVREKEDVATEARRDGRVVHFGSLNRLCHRKFSELTPDKHNYKGRTVFRGGHRERPGQQLGRLSGHGQLR